MNELKSLLHAAGELRARDEPFALATVVRVRGSSYRRPGARMLLTRDRWIAGSVSGGCLEGDLVRKGWWRTERGAAVVTYDARADDDVGWGLGLGCDGVVDVLLERAPPREVDPIALIERCLREQARGAIATVFGGDAAPIGARVALGADGTIASSVGAPAVRAPLAEACAAVRASGVTEVACWTTEDGAVEALVEALRPPPRLFVFGAGHDAVPVVAIAQAAGFEVIVCEPNARFATRDRFAGADAIVTGAPSELAAIVDASDRAFAVVMGHDYARDRATLDALRGTRALYIGMLGPRRRTARMLGELGAGSSDPRVHAPVGLAIGAESPQEIALSIVAEAQAVATRTSAASLRDEPGPVHAAIAGPAAAAE